MRGKEGEVQLTRLRRILAAVMAALGLLGTGLADTPDGSRLVVGNPTAMSGNFTLRLWGNNTSDLDVASLLNGYNLIRHDHAYDYYDTDPSVVNSLHVIERNGEKKGKLVPGDVAGNRTYVFTLNEDLRYSDGTSITAWDYAFSILLCSAPAIRELGGNTDQYAPIFGSDAYRKGKSRTMAGVRVLGDHVLSLTVKKEFLPCFYELGYLRCFPLPIQEIAPDCEILDDGKGAYIKGRLTASLLQETLLDPDTGYLSHPQVVSGPYRLVSYDRTRAEAEFEINDEYLGSTDANRPRIRHLTLKAADNETMMAELEAGEYGLLNKVTRESSIARGLGSVVSGQIGMTSYARTGMSYLAFSCEREPVDSQAVRQALSCCLDKEKTVLGYGGSYALRVDGYYGVGQWMYQVVTGMRSHPAQRDVAEITDLDPEAWEEAWEELSLDGVRRYELNPEEAVRILEEEGWTLNEAGDPFRPGEDEVRCRRKGRKLIPLRLTLAYPEGNAIGEILEETFLPYLQQAGVRVTLVPLEWQALLRQFYRQDPREYDMIYLASNFSDVFDPRASFDPADAKTGRTNCFGISDQELYRLTQEMVSTDPGDTLTYERRWLAFQQRFQEVVPAIPIYSNVYFDFYTTRLSGYQVSSKVTWSEAILRATLAEE